MQLSEHFTLEELTLSDFAVRHGIDNTPTNEVIDNLRQLCVHVLEPLRTLIGKPIGITSGYRSPLVNQAIGGAKTSQHVKGQAADIHVSGITVPELFAIVKSSGIKVDQCISEFDRWVHVSYGGGRGEYLTATKDSEGNTIYSPA